MKLIWLGTGSAFANLNWQTNAIIEFDDGYRLLIDCGGDIRHSLRSEDLSFTDVNGVYVSHLHADHIGGLEGLAFSTYFNPGYNGRPELFASRFLMRELWYRSLSGGLASLQGQDNILSTYFDIHSVGKNGSFEVRGTEFRLVQTVHVVNGFSVEPSFGLLFDTPNAGTVFITTDTQYCPNQIQDFYDKSDVIFQDCETAPFRSGVHAHFDELSELSDKTKAKMFLIHYQDNVINECAEILEKWEKKASEAGFRGFVVPGTKFQL